MPRHSYLLILSCLVVMTFFMCFAGCSSEEGKDEIEAKSTVTESPETDSQKPVPADKEADAEKGKSSAAVEGLATEQKGTTSTAEEPDHDAVSGDRTPPSEMVLFAKLWETHTKGAVLFNHENHVKTHQINCRDCHHVYEDGKNVWNKGMPTDKCETCHNEPTIKGEKDLPPDDQKKNLKLAFHNNCRGCHKQTKKGNPESKAPLKCSECHQKKG